MQTFSRHLRVLRHFPLAYPPVAKVELVPPGGARPAGGLARQQRQPSLAGRERGLVAACEKSLARPEAPSRQKGLSFQGRRANPWTMNSLTLSRRQFIHSTSCTLGSGWLGLHSAFGAPGEAEVWEPDRPFARLGGKLKLQPVFMYSLPSRKEAASWRSWGGVQTEQGVAEELARIQRELAQMAGRAEFGVELLPLAKVTSVEAVRRLAAEQWDVTLVYACTGGGAVLRACLELRPESVVFVRQRSGPVYYWYEALSTQYLRTDAAAAASPSAGRLPAHVEDVVVDDYGELLWRLRALHGAKSFLGTRIVALGGPGGKYAPDAPQKSQERFGLEIIEVSYDEFAPRIQQALGDREVMARAERWAQRYLALPHTTQRTERKFVVNAFVLYRLFKELMREHAAPAFTIQACMSTIIPMAQTTACLPLALLNDEGLIAFCESDFVIIPAGLLLRYIAGKPVFLHNSTFPHQGMVTCAHCTCPRRMDTRHYESVQLLTHYESDYGAAPKVEMPLGQELTFVDPEYSKARWLGFKGTVQANPAYAICRSQQDVLLAGAWQRLIPEVRDSHWVTAYGDYLKELGYAARKLGVQWVSLA